MLERGGDIRVQAISNLKSETIHQIIAQNIEPGSNVMTDEFAGYRGLSRNYRHHTVNHSIGEYVKHFYNHTNGIEGVWALLKRQIVGVHHWISEKHLARYLDEISWRYNRRAW